MQLKIEKNCIYWLNAEAMKNHYGNIIGKKRPFICINIIKIDGIKYFYFIPGTSKNFQNIKVKHFIKYFITFKQNEINNLSKNTSFQCNTIYVIPEENINIFLFLF